MCLPAVRCFGCLIGNLWEVFMTQGVISELNIYPVKSLQGISLQQAQLTEQGIQWDRFWMIVNEEGQFATQRHLSQMAQIKTELSADSLTLSHPEFEPLTVALDYQGDQRKQAKVWNSECTVLEEGEEAREWLTKVIGLWRGQQLSLVRMATDFSRAVSEKHTDGAQNSTFFADGYPYLVCNTASLQTLNQTLTAKQEEAIPMSRFRANIVVATEQAFIEHSTQHLLLADEQKLHLCKPCMRCKVTSIDQRSGIVNSPKEPLKTLLAMNNVEQKGAFFGQNAVVAEATKAQLPVTIKVGDQVHFQ